MILFCKGFNLPSLSPWRAGGFRIVLPGFDIFDLQALTPDGTKIVGYGFRTESPFNLRSFMITLGTPVDAPVAPAFSSTLTIFPNPTTGATRLSFDLRRRGRGLLSLFTIQGRAVRRLATGELAAGRNQLVWDGRDEHGARVPPGLYYARLEVGDTRETGKVIVIR